MRVAGSNPVVRSRTPCSAGGSSASHHQPRPIGPLWSDETVVELCRRGCGSDGQADLCVEHVPRRLDRGRARRLRLGPTGRRRVRVHHRHHAVGRHLPLRAAHVRDDGRLGDRRIPGHAARTSRATFADVWQAADKVVYSTTLATVPTAKTRLERQFDPGAVRDLKAAATSDVLVGGPHLAAQAFEAGLVDECHLLIWPVAWVGATRRWRPTGAPSSSSSTSAGSATASCTSAIARSRKLATSWGGGRPQR